MQQTSLALMPVGTFYTLGTVACWLVHTRKLKGIVYSPIRLFRIYKPVIKAFAIGFLPAALIIAFIAPDTPEELSTAIWVYSAGLLVSGVLVHRDLLSRVETPRPWQITISVITAFGAALSVVFFFLMGS